MSKDYASQFHQRSRSRSASLFARLLSPIFWLIVLVIASAICGTSWLVWKHLNSRKTLAPVSLAKANTHLVPVVSAKQHVKQNKIKIALKKPVVETKDLPTFDFYQILPKMQVHVTDQDEQHLNVSTRGQSIGVDSVYMLQVATFTQYKDAVRLRDRLNRLGFPTYLKLVDRVSNKLYRVMVGPYEMKSAAIEIQKRLVQKHFDSMLRKRTI